jgi:hypothetical protein
MVGRALLAMFSRLGESGGSGSGTGTSTSSTPFGDSSSTSTAQSTTSTRPGPAEAHGGKHLQDPHWRARSALRILEQQQGDVNLFFTDVVLPGGIGGAQLAGRVKSRSLTA